MVAVEAAALLEIRTGLRSVKVIQSEEISGDFPLRRCSRVAEVRRGQSCEVEVEAAKKMGCLRPVRSTAIPKPFNQELNNRTSHWYFILQHLSGDWYFCCNM
jgi:hypothetical protein